MKNCSSSLCDEMQVRLQQQEKNYILAREKLENAAKEISSQKELMESEKAMMQEEWDRIRARQNQNLQTMTTAAPTISQTRIVKKIS